MSSTSQGPGWWLASDGRWYAPEQHPGASQVVAQPAPQQLAQPQSYPPPQPQMTSGLAVASLVLSILWIGGLGSILAIIFGFIARSNIKRSNGRKTGNGLAIAGISVGFVGVGGLALLIVLVVALGNAANTIVQDLTPRTVAYGTTVNVFGGSGNPGLKSVTVNSLTNSSILSQGGHDVFIARMRVCADSSGSQSGFDSSLTSVYFADGQTGAIGSETIGGMGRNMNDVNSLAANQCVSGYFPFDVAAGTRPIGVEYVSDFFRTIRWTS